MARTEAEQSLLVGRREPVRRRLARLGEDEAAAGIEEFCNQAPLVAALESARLAREAAEQQAAEADEGRRAADADVHRWTARVVAPMSRSSRSISLPRAARVVPSGQAGAGAACATSGSHSRSRRQPSTAASSLVRDLGLFDLDPGPPLPGVADGPLGRGPLPAEGVEAGGRRPGRLRPLPPLVAEAAVDFGQDGDALADRPVEAA